MCHAEKRRGSKGEKRKKDIPAKLSSLHSRFHQCMKSNVKKINNSLTEHLMKSVREKLYKRCVIISVERDRQRERRNRGVEKRFVKGYICV